MDNKVGDELPTQSEVEEAVKSVQKVLDKADRYLTSLTKEQRTSALKPRTGYGVMVPQIAGMAKRHGVALPGISIDGMQADLTLVSRLEPLAQIADALAQRVTDTQIQAASECWHAATALYTSLARVASASPDLEREITPVVEFFATGRRKPVKAPTP